MGYILYLLLEVVVGKVKDLHASVCSGHGQALHVAVEGHGPDGAGHVVKETDTVHLKLPHLALGQKKKQFFQ